jgi:hypothetical protein
VVKKEEKKVVHLVSTFFRPTAAAAATQFSDSPSSGASKKKKKKNRTGSKLIHPAVVVKYPRHSTIKILFQRKPPTKFQAKHHALCLQKPLGKYKQGRNKWEKRARIHITSRSMKAFPKSPSNLAGNLDSQSSSWYSHYSSSAPKQLETLLQNVARVTALMQVVLEPAAAQV